MLTHTASHYRLHLSQIIWIFVNSQKALGDTSETFQALMFHFLGAGVFLFRSQSRSNKFNPYGSDQIPDFFSISPYGLGLELNFLVFF